MRRLIQDCSAGGRLRGLLVAQPSGEVHRQRRHEVYLVSGQGSEEQTVLSGRQDEWAFDDAEVSLGGGGEIVPAGTGVKSDAEMVQRLARSAEGHWAPPFLRHF